MNAPRPIRALAFDMDGTLTDSDPIHREAFARALAPFGIPMTEERYRHEFSGRTNAEIGRHLFPDRTAEEHDRFAQAKENLFRHLATTLKPLPGLMPLLEEADARGLRTALVTNAPRENAEHMLRALGLSDRFETIVLGEEAARPKPDPMPYRLAVERLGVEPGEAVAFEDSVPGVRSARGAGLVTIGVTTSQTSQTLERAGADHTVADFRDSLVRQLLAGTRLVEPP